MDYDEEDKEKLIQKLVNALKNKSKVKRITLLNWRKLKNNFNSDGTL